MIISVIKFLLDPFNILWLWVSLALIVWPGKKRLGKGLAVSALLWFLLISTPLVPTVLINSLENQYAPLNVGQLSESQKSISYNILVLGGGHGYDERLPANSLLSLNALGRLGEGLRLYQALPGSVLILSGSTSTPGRATQAEILQQAVRALGGDKYRIVVQSRPATTYEEARFYARKFRGEKPLILITSATHMPRAMQAFTRYGINPIPSPANYRLKGSWKRHFLGLPSLDNIENMRVAIYEYAGMLQYNWLLPGR